MSKDSTAVLPCSCPSGFQDQRYGVGQRVHNKGKGLARDSHLWRCTVCGKER